MADALLAAGVSTDRVQAALAGEAPAAAAAPETIPHTSTMSPALTARQAREMADELVKAGMPADKVQAALTGDGVAREAAAPDQRTEVQIEYDEAWGAPPSPGDYKVDYVSRAIGTDTRSVHEFDGLAQGWLAAMGFPAAVGSGVIETAMDVGQTVAQLSPAARTEWVLSQRPRFERMAGGPDRATERMALAAKALSRAPRVFTDALLVSGALHDAGIVMHLANQGQRLAARG
jgi:hypothetical protein